MKRELIVAAIITFMTACTFKSGSKPKAELGTFNISFESGEGKVRTLQRSFSGDLSSLSSQQVVTLPEKIPSEIKLGGVVPPGFRFPKIDSSISFADQTLELRTKNYELDTESSELRFSFEIEGLRTVFTDTLNDDGTLNVFMKEGNRTFEIHLPLRTPAKSLKHTLLTRAQLRESSPRVFDNFGVVQVADTKFTMLKVMALQNESDSPIKLTIPTIALARLFVKSTKRTPRDLGCVDGPGFTMDEIRSEDLIDTKVYFVQLKANIVSKLAAVTSRRSNAGSEFEIAAKTKIEFGIYTDSEASNLWTSSLLPRHEFAAVLAPGKCTRKCIRYESEGNTGGHMGRGHYVRPRPLDRRVANAPSICVQWQENREPTAVASGIWREFPSLEISKELNVTKVTFLSQDDSDPEGRSLSLVNEGTQILP